MGNISGGFAGQKDVPLSENGVLQAQHLRSFFKDKRIDRIYTSMLQRTIKTAELALPGKKDEFINLPGLNEINGGDWEGKPYEEIYERWGDEFGKWRNAPHLAQPPNGETMHEVSKRALSTINEIVSDNDPDSTIAIFAHGALIKTVIIHLRDLPMSELLRVAWYENSSVTEINYDNGIYSLGFYDNHDHLPEDIKTVANSEWGRTQRTSCKY